MLAWSVLDLTGVAAPPDVRDVETIGNKLDTYLTYHYSSKMSGKQLPRREPARSRRVAELDAICCAVDHGGNVVRYDGPFLEPATSRPATPAVPTAPPPRLPFTQSRLPADRSAAELQGQLNAQRDAAASLGARLEREQMRVEQSRQQADVARVKRAQANERAAAEREAAAEARAEADAANKQATTQLKRSAKEVEARDAKILKLEQHVGRALQEAGRESQRADRLEQTKRELCDEVKQLKANAEAQRQQRLEVERQAAKERKQLEAQAAAERLRLGHQ
eukprot:7386626-Prymnesium_polylepis.1